MFNTKLNFQNLLLLLVASILILTVGCKKDDEGTEQEQITKVIVHLIGNGGSTFNQEFEAEDPDGDGVWNTIPNLDIPANAVFDAQIHVYDGAGELNGEIESERDEHLFVYKVTGANLTIGDRNLDSNGKPFGIYSKWTSGAASTGSVQIQLIHEPTDKNAADPGGEVDFDVTFTVRVQ